jgi:hypothetical protein
MLSLCLCLCVVKDVTELAPLLFVPQILFGGFFIRTSLIPVWLRWAQYVCGMKYGALMRYYYGYYLRDSRLLCRANYVKQFP